MNEVIYSVIVNLNGSHLFYGTFDNRTKLLNSMRETLDIENTYIQGPTKQMEVNLITLANGFQNNGLIIHHKKSKDWYIKILRHNINEISPCF